MTDKAEFIRLLQSDPEFRQAVQAALATPQPTGAPLAAPVGMPDDVQQGPDGVCFRTVDGVQIRVCEDCWQAIPRYVDFTYGLVSPESDGSGGNGAKRRWAEVSGKYGWEHLAKVVCLPCYLAAFTRVYPDAPLPEMRSDAIEVVQPYIPEPTVTIYADAGDVEVTRR